MVSLPALIGGLVLDCGASWIRMFVALGFSILFSLGIGILAARSRRAEHVILPVLDVLQTLPILAFFPFVIFIIVGAFPGSLGINGAVVFLIMTSMLWNIAFGVYEAVKALPNQYIEVAQLYSMSRLDRIRKIFVPAAMPRVVEQSVLSWAIGLFYLVTSEIFSTGNANYQVQYGIGVAIANLAASGNYQYYAIAIAVFIAFVIATRFLFFMPLEKHFSAYNETSGQQRRGRSIHFVMALKRSMRMPNRIVDIGKGARIVSKAGGAVKRVEVFSIKKPRIGKTGRTLAKAGAVSAAAVTLYAIVTFYPWVIGAESEVIVDLAASFARVWVAFLAILLVSVPLSVYLVFMSRHRGSYVLLFQVVASIPATVLLPAIVVELSGAPMSGELVAFVVFFLSGIWYVVFSIIASTRTLPSSVFEVRSVFGVKGFAAWRRIYLKAILPGLITGAVTGIAAEWNASIVAEYFTTSGISGTNVISSVGTGIGKLLDLSLGNGNLALMVIALVNLTVMIILINTFVWKRLYSSLAKVYG